MKRTRKESPLACDMSAFSADERERHLAEMKELFAGVTSMRELARGYAFELDLGEGMLQHAAAFVENERRCCPFFDFRIEVESGSGSMWLTLTGADDMKAFIRAELGAFLPDSIVQQPTFSDEGRVAWSLTAGYLACP